MNKYEFLDILMELFEECKTSEEIESRKAELINCVNTQADLCKKYLDAGIL